MTGYERGTMGGGVPVDRYRREPPARAWPQPRLAPADFSVPLHVDCSIEYELPDCAKPPQGVEIEPLLMIHPSHFRRLESLRRVPFVNDLPGAGGNVAAAAAAGGGARRPRCCRAPPAAPPPPPASAALPPPDYRLLLDELLAREAPQETFVPDSCCGELRAFAPCAALEASLGKYHQRRQRTSKAVHPYLTTGVPDPSAPPDCDITAGLQGNLAATSYDRLARRKVLPRLPVYM